MLVGLNWDLIWVPVAAAGAVIVLHIAIRIVQKMRAGGDSNSVRPPRQQQ